MRNRNSVTTIRVGKTVYDPPDPRDGKRILVMRLWPRGVQKRAVDLWLKDVGCSRKLISDWKSGRISWTEFRAIYRREMKGSVQRKIIEELREIARSGPVTFLCSCKDPSRCHRSLLKQLVEKEA